MKSLNQPINESTNQLKSLWICSLCVLPETFPGIRFNAEGVCNFCQDYQVKKARIDQEKERYHQKFLNLLNQLNQPNRPHNRSYDVLMAFSGGKDSSYTLRVLKKEYGLKILALTFNNGFLSSFALKNAQSVCESLQIDHLIVSPNAETLYQAFRESISREMYPLKALERASSVCNTCMNLVKSYLLKTAIEMGIPLIAYGWSPGQAPVQSSVMKWNLPMIRQTQVVLTNTIQKVMGEYLNGFKLSDRHFEIIKMESDDSKGPFLYNVHPLAFLDYDEDRIIKSVKELGWQSPVDTDSNSTNCRLNAFGINTHQKQFGFHPYAFEIAGLVRGGYMTREEGLEKLSTPPDEKIIQEVKNKLGLLRK